MPSPDRAIRARPEVTRAHSQILVGGDASSDLKSSADLYSAEDPSGLEKLGTHTYCVVARSVRDEAISQRTV